MYVIADQDYDPDPKPEIDVQRAWICGMFEFEFERLHGLHPFFEAQPIWTFRGPGEAKEGSGRILLGPQQRGGPEALSSGCVLRAVLVP